MGLLFSKLPFDFFANGCHFCIFLVSKYFIKLINVVCFQLNKLISLNAFKLNKCLFSFIICLFFFVFFFCLVCDENSLPVYTNGEALSLNTDTAPYFVGEEVSYTCDDGYVPNLSDDTFKCTCTTSSSGGNPSWQCDSEETDNTCQIRKSLCSVWYRIQGGP